MHKKRKTDSEEELKKATADVSSDYNPEEDIYCRDEKVPFNA